jgi:hypothetical protein
VPSGAKPHKGGTGGPDDLNNELVITMLRRFDSSGGGTISFLVVFLGTCALLALTPSSKLLILLELLPFVHPRSHSGLSTVDGPGWNVAPSSIAFTTCIAAGLWVGYSTGFVTKYCTGPVRVQPCCASLRETIPPRLARKPGRAPHLVLVLLLALCGGARGAATEKQSGGTAGSAATGLVAGAQERLGGGDARIAAGKLAGGTTAAGAGQDAGLGAHLRFATLGNYAQNSGRAPRASGLRGRAKIDEELQEKIYEADDDGFGALLVRRSAGAVGTADTGEYHRRLAGCPQGQYESSWACYGCPDGRYQNLGTETSGTGRYPTRS